MRAATLLNGSITVDELPIPVPGPMQVLVKTRRCAICASDTHFVTSADVMIENSKRFGGPYANIDLTKPIAMGHEFVAEIVEYGPQTQQQHPVGTRVTAIPGMVVDDQLSIVGYDSSYPGGFAEYMLLFEPLMLAVPDEVSDDLATLVEPLAVGLEHARAGHPTVDDTVLVIGAGAIGLGVIAGLKKAGVERIIAADLDAGRRDLAVQMGATFGVDPRETSPYGPQKAFDGKQVDLVYECVGRRGMLNQIIPGLGVGARIVMGGYSLEPEELLVPPAQDRRLTIYFASGEELQDMALALASIADGSIDVRSWVGRTIGLEEVAAAIPSINAPSSPIRTLVDPAR
ncbi:zinc-binding dehydrogenase [Microbacterium album]|uniref:Alcohol dehydrogenase n=1 Tax=Microbacterium album TaxID=2053191 RepID=A0A917IHR4_9MICO|nr:zinc-binding dehydrogenase [Microbacterium album]GGH47168.1 alcohol dehydrogenase [Microbacterium album]